METPGRVRGGALGGVPPRAVGHVGEEGEDVNARRAERLRSACAPSSATPPESPPAGPGPGPDRDREQDRDQERELPPRAPGWAGETKTEPEDASLRSARFVAPSSRRLGGGRGVGVRRGRERATVQGLDQGERVVGPDAARGADRAAEEKAGMTRRGGGGRRVHASVSSARGASRHRRGRSSAPPGVDEGRWGFCLPESARAAEEALAARARRRSSRLTGTTDPGRPHRPSRSNVLGPFRGRRRRVRQSPFEPHAGATAAALVRAAALLARLGGADPLGRDAQIPTRF